MPDSVCIPLTPIADGLIVVSRAMHEEYAVPGGPQYRTFFFLTVPSFV
jgi:hypothetical protein